ncbi:unnamed protein product [Jaminaea pallidilutea]
MTDQDRGSATPGQNVSGTAADRDASAVRSPSAASKQRSPATKDAPLPSLPSGSSQRQTSSFRASSPPESPTTSRSGEPVSPARRTRPSTGNVASTTSRKWPLAPRASLGQRPATASTVQSFSSATTDVEASYEEAEEQRPVQSGSQSSNDISSPRAVAAVLPSLSKQGRETSSSGQSSSRNRSGGKDSRRISLSGKIGKSFEAALASNDTWLLKESSEVAGGYSSEDAGEGSLEGALVEEDEPPEEADGPFTRARSTGASSCDTATYSRPEGTFSAADSRQMQGDRSGNDEGPISAPLSDRQGVPSARDNMSSLQPTSSSALSSRTTTTPVYPGATITRITMNKSSSRDFNPTRGLSKDSSGASMPFPRDNPSGKVNKGSQGQPSVESGAGSSISGSKDAEVEPSQPQGVPIPPRTPGSSRTGQNESRATTPNQGTSFIKRSAGFFKRMKGGASNDRRTYGDANASSAARTSTPSLHNSTSQSYGPFTRRGSSPWSSSVPSSPAAGSTRFGADQQKQDAAHPAVPAVPAIPARYTSDSLKRANSGQRPSSGEGGAGSALAGAIQLRTPAAEAKSPSMTKSRPPDITVPPVPSKGDLRRLAQDDVGNKEINHNPAGDMQHTLKAWATEMDDALKTSAQDLDRKTKFTPKATWGPSPELPQLGLGLGIDGTDHVEDSSSGRREEGSRASHHGNGASSAPPTPTSLLAGSVEQRRTASSMGAAPPLPAEGWSPTGSPTTHKPWERSRSPYLNTTPSLGNSGRGEGFAGSKTSSNQANTAPLSLGSANGHEVSSDSAAYSTPRPLATSIDAAANTSVESTYSSGPGNASNRANESFGSRSAALPQSRSAAGTGNRVSADSKLVTTPTGSTSRRPGHETASAASVVSFETAADGDTQGSSADPSLPVTSDQGVNGAGFEAVGWSGATQDDSDDEDDLEKHPEKSIRVVHSGSPIEERGLVMSSATADAASKLSANDPRSGSLGRSSSNGSRGPTTPTMMPQSKSQTTQGNELVRSFSGSSRAVQVDSATLERAKEAADQCWREDEALVKRDKMAEWLGGIGPLRQAARESYFEYFDFKDERVDASLRKLCDKLFLRAETQQVDRILGAFSQRYWQCNPLPMYGSADNVHAVVFSLLLLNTDLHVADISERMTRAQFVRNTTSAVSSSDATTHGDTVAALRKGAISPLSAADSENASIRSGTSTDAAGHHEMLFRPPSTRARDSIVSMGRSTPMASTRSKARSSLLPERRPDVELESVLKDMYNAVKADRIRLPMSDGAGGLGGLPTSNASVSRRGGPPPSSLGTASGNKVSQLKRGSIRGVQGLLGSHQAMQSAERMSLPDSQSSAASRSGIESNLAGTSAGTSATSWDVDTPGSSGSAGPQVASPVAKTLGFASMLNSTIVKEAQEEEHQKSAKAGLDLDDDIDDDELALVGAPWAKEGMLFRKHYWEAASRRARDKSWTELFVVVQQGTLSTFRFGDQGTGSNRTMGRNAGQSLAGAVGGGNWLSNATRLDDLPLAHALANALPPPGYNKARPHVFALTLPSGAVYFFQAGTEDLVQEWVSTCNYWAARQSKPPLAGGVSNMEYGWNKVMPFPADEGEDDDEEEDAEADVTISNAEDREAEEEEEEPNEVLNDASSTTSAVATRSGVVGGQLDPKGSQRGDTRSIRSARSGKSVGSKFSHAMGGGRNNATVASRIPSLANVFQDPTQAQPPSSSRLSFSGSRRPGTMRGLSNGSSLANQGAFPHERIHINEWKAPAAPTVPSTLKEEDQMEMCISYIARTETELTEHNELRQPMLSLYSPRGTNYGRALSNWERKSNHLLAELVKWQSYVESLNAATRLKNEKRDQRQMEWALARADEEMAKVREEELIDPDSSGRVERGGEVG